MAVGCCVVLCCVDMLRELAGCAYVDRMDTLIVHGLHDMTLSFA